MILQKGDWLGSGSLLVEGATQRPSLNVELSITEDDDGFTLSGELGGDERGAISIRVAPDEVGTYIVDARVATKALDGRGKLESEPNLLLLWDEGQTQSASVALFRTSNGVGCRGFWQSAGQTRTWEILFKLKQVVVAEPNVVSLSSRRVSH